MAYNYKETNKYTTKEIWEASTGLQEVDGLKPSKYLIELANSNIQNKLSFVEIKELLYKYHEDTTNNTKEADLVSMRIAEVLENNEFVFSPIGFVDLHSYLFSDIYPLEAGVVRKVNLSKEEPILNYESVKYANWNSINNQMEYDFTQEKNFDYENLSIEKMIHHFAEFTRNIWQTHPFMEGNTRTTAVFMQLYLNSKGFSVNNDLFRDKSLYFRNALVRANYADYPKGIIETTKYLEKFYDNLLLDKEHELTNQELICAELFQDKYNGLGQDDNNDGFDPADDD